MKIDEKAFLAAAKKWHKILCGDAFVPWDSCAERFRESFLRDCRSVIDAYEAAKNEQPDDWHVAFTEFVKERGIEPGWGAHDAAMKAFESAWNARPMRESVIDEKRIERWLLKHGTVRVNEDGSVVLCANKAELMKALTNIEGQS